MVSARTEEVLAYDLGGTKVAVGIVDRQGKVIEQIREPVVISKGKEAVIEQLADLGKHFLNSYPKTRSIGMASAGPLDPYKGELLDPTNMVTNGHTWGKVPIAARLKAKLRRSVLLESDAAAAILAEHWLGEAKGHENAMILTLGTGLGTGILANGKLVRAGRSLHPEAGHISLIATDQSAPCGCGNFGCAEAYLSGRNFERRVQAKWNQPGLTSKTISELARAGDSRARAAFDEYAYMMALAITSYVVLYAPEVIVLAGSFAQTADLFIPNTEKHLEVLLKRRRVGIDLLPKIRVSSLSNNAGLLGGAYVALHKQQY